MEVQAGTFNPADFSWQGLTMTPAAAAHIRDLMRKQPDKKGLRLGIKTSGCAGFGYVLEMIAEPAADDLLFEHDGAKLWAPLQATQAKPVLHGCGKPTAARLRPVPAAPPGAAPPRALAGGRRPAGGGWRAGARPAPAGKPGRRRHRAAAAESHSAAPTPAACPWTGRCRARQQQSTTAAEPGRVRKGSWAGRTEGDQSS